MKTNLTDLMQKVASLEKEKDRLYRKIYENHMNKKTIELTGQEQSLIEIKDFEESFNKYTNLLSLITYYKGIIDEKNNTFELDNKTVKQYIIYNKYLNEEYDLLNALVDEKETKRRISETNNSYFEVKVPAYNIDQIKTMITNIQQQIQDNETKIITLNNKEFEIDDNIINSFEM